MKKPNDTSDLRDPLDAIVMGMVPDILGNFIDDCSVRDYWWTSSQYKKPFHINHLAKFIAVRKIATHPYFNRAMDAMYARLTNGTALPPSQVVRTTPRGGAPGAAPAITAVNVPSFVAAPAAAGCSSWGSAAAPPTPPTR